MRTNHIWKVGNLHCKISVAWLMAQSNLVSPTHCNDVFIVNLLIVVSAALFCKHLKNIVFTCYIYHTNLLYRSLASVGLAQARPNNWCALPVFFIDEFLLINVTLL